MMKHRMNVNRHVAQRFAWMKLMLESKCGFHSVSVTREVGGDSLNLRHVIDFGKALTSNGSDGAIVVIVPDTDTDDEAEAKLMAFVDSLPEPKAAV